MALQDSPLTESVDSPATGRRKRVWGRAGSGICESGACQWPSGEGVPLRDAATGEGVPLRDAATGEAFARMPTAGVDAEAAVEHRRTVVVPALRELTFHDCGRDSPSVH